MWQGGRAARRGPWQADSFRINHAHTQKSEFTAPLSGTAASVTLHFQRDGAVLIKVPPGALLEHSDIFLQPDKMMPL